MTASPRPSCSVDGCDSHTYARGYCLMHYRRVRKTGDPGPAERIRGNRNTDRPCSVDGCDSSSDRGSEYCNMHRLRVRRNGTTQRLPRPRPVCSVDGCDGTARALGWCKMHRKRVTRHGHTDPQPPPPFVPAPCSVDGCERITQARGYCGMHYSRVKKTGDPGPTGVSYLRASGVCSVDGCESQAKNRGYCGMHYSRVKKTGDPGPAERKTKRWNGKRLDKNGYRVISISGKPILEHRYVMEQHLGRHLWPDENVHHLNGDRADNRLENLELWSKAQPAGQRVADKISYAVEILARYAPHILTGDAAPLAAPQPRPNLTVVRNS